MISSHVLAEVGASYMRGPMINLPRPEVQEGDLPIYDRVTLINSVARGTIQLASDLADRCALLLELLDRVARMEVRARVQSRLYRLSLVLDVELPIRTPSGVRKRRAGFSEYLQHTSRL